MVRMGDNPIKDPACKGPFCQLGDSRYRCVAERPPTLKAASAGAGLAGEERLQLLAIQSLVFSLEASCAPTSVEELALLQGISQILNSDLKPVSDI